MRLSFMRTRSSLFILILALALLSAFLAYEPRRFASVQNQVSGLIATIPHPVIDRLPPASEEPAVQTRIPDSKPTGKSVALARIVRVPAIREAQNYGWIQLPHGTRVDVIEERREGFLIRYDENYVVVPRAAVDDGSVVLRARRGESAS